MAEPDPLRPTFETLYAAARSYLPDVLPLLGVSRSDVEDLVHDIVLAAHEALERRGGELPPVAPGADPERTLKAWLSAVAWRQATTTSQATSGKRRGLPAGSCREAGGRCQEAGGIRRGSAGSCQEAGGSRRDSGGRRQDASGIRRRAGGSC